MNAKLLTLAFLSCYGLWALPEQPHLVSGTLALQASQDLLELTTQDRTILEWQRFSIAKGETVNFLQPSSRACVLNRVAGADMSEIYGALKSNGSVYLINPRGILIGEEGLIDTASFLGSTLDFSNAQFLAGEDLSLQGDSEASFIHLGTIRCDSGDLMIIAHKIDQRGSLSAPKGSVSLSCSHDVLIKSSHYPILNYRADLQGAELDDFGSVEALSAYLQSDAQSGIGIRQHGTIALVKEGEKSF